MTPFAFYHFIPRDDLFPGSEMWNFIWPEFNMVMGPLMKGPLRQAVEEALKE